MERPQPNADLTVLGYRRPKRGAANNNQSCGCLLLFFFVLICLAGINWSLWLPIIGYALTIGLLLWGAFATNTSYKKWQNSLSSQDYSIPAADDPDEIDMKARQLDRRPDSEESQTTIDGTATSSQAADPFGFYEEDAPHFPGYEDDESSTPWTSPDEGLEGDDWQ